MRKTTRKRTPKFTQTQKEQIKRFKDFKEKTGIHITYEMRGKMAGMIALSSSPIGNERCMARHNNGIGICGECYSCAQSDYCTTMEQAFERNGQILSAEIIPIEEWVKINANAWKKMRIESHGDTRNWIQAANYYNLAKRNPKVVFTAWTKNPDHYAEAIENGYEKPKNFILVGSSLMLNEPMKVDKYITIIDYVFTVYTFEYIKANDIKPWFINCGARSCKKCALCYTIPTIDSPFYVNEILKKDANKVYKWWREKGYLPRVA